MEPIDEVAEIAPPMDDEIYVIDEHMIGEIPIVKKNSNTPVKTEESAPETATQPETETPEVYSPEEFDVVLVSWWPMQSPLIGKCHLVHQCPVCQRNDLSQISAHRLT
jgi:hypothetical protein